MKWISVEERLPDEYEWVLFLDCRRTDGYACFVACIKDISADGTEGGVEGPNDFDIRCQLTDVTHWMPLPEPPNEEDKWVR